MIKKVFFIISILIMSCSSREYKEDSGIKESVGLGADKVENKLDTISVNYPFYGCIEVDSIRLNNVIFKNKFDTISHSHDENVEYFCLQNESYYPSYIIVTDFKFYQFFPLNNEELLIIKVMNQTINEYWVIDLTFPRGWEFRKNFEHKLVCSDMIDEKILMYKELYFYMKKGSVSK